VIFAAGIGLLLNPLTVVVGVVIHHLWLPTLFPQPIIAWALFILFSGISLLEIPVMIYGLRKMVEGAKPTTIKVALFTVGVFVSFAAIYALPNILLTDLKYLWMGVLLSSLSLIRFSAAIIFLPKQ